VGSSSTTHISPASSPSPTSREHSKLAEGQPRRQAIGAEATGVLSSRVGYTGGDVPNATYRNHGTHSEAFEIGFDSEQTSSPRSGFEVAMDLGWIVTMASPTNPSDRVTPSCSRPRERCRPPLVRLSRPSLPARPEDRATPGARGGRHSRKGNRERPGRSERGDRPMPPLPPTRPQDGVSNRGQPPTRLPPGV
jgi:Peptide methionine sulfoxide reductase